MNNDDWFHRHISQSNFSTQQSSDGASFNVNGNNNFPGILLIPTRLPLPSGWSMASPFHAFVVATLQQFWSETMALLGSVVDCPKFHLYRPVFSQIAGILYFMHRLNTSAISWEISANYGFHQRQITCAQQDCTFSISVDATLSQPVAHLIVNLRLIPLASLALQRQFFTRISIASSFNAGL